MKKLLVLLAIGLIASSSFASTYDFYGSVRLQSFYESKDKDYSGIGKSDTDLSFGTQGNSRIGANVKTGDKLTANFELGLGTSEDGSNTVKTRVLYAIYDFGGFKMKIGQDYTPSDFEPFAQVAENDNGLDRFGGISVAPSGQIAFSFGDFDIALISNTKQSDKENLDVTMPKIEAAYNYKFGNVSGKAFAGYQTYKYDNATSDKTVNAYVAGLGVTAAFSPVTLNAVGWFGRNTGEYGVSKGGSYDVLHDKNSSDFGVAAEVGFEATKNLIFNVGYGYQRTDIDSAMKADAQQSYYANAIITIAKGFYITPEISVLDYMKNSSGNKEGKVFYYGAQFKANF
ncbi:MAG: porin [Calditerrivibrio sp.]|nr:porin [Calditerrivibrio sp.]